jgi:energy-coupling factor transport system substrate-specific component
LSWPLASFAIVLGSLLVGWLAYERARPSARTIAVVATLAALAALGRDAFVALPEVKPITAMTLVVGYALGPMAGFTVGAVGMLASNVLLGQGPWTPWQMAAWGLVGLVGAGVGWLSGRNLNRWQLALVCAAAALMAKEIMNVYDWSLGGIYTPAALAASVAEGLPFDLTNTAASFVFGFAFGPELARVLARMRTRMEVRWEPSGAAASISLLMSVLVLGAVGLGATRAAGASARAAPGGTTLEPEVSYLKRAQAANGGFGAAPGTHPSELYTGWAAMGLAAAAQSPQGLRRDGHSVLDALREEAPTLTSTGDFERTILAVHACGAQARTIGGVDLEAKLLSAGRADGSFADQVNLTAFAILALRAEGRSPHDGVVRAAGRWLERQQNADGGFDFATRGSFSEVDDTGAALEAIAAAGLDPRTLIARAVAYMARAQNLDGGFPEDPGEESNAQSTAWAVQGLVAAGRNVEAIKRSGSRSPLGYLETLVEADGSVRYSRTSAQTPVWVTAEVLMALARKPLPIEPPRG